MSSIGYTITDHTIAIIADGETILVPRQGDRGKRIIEALKAGGVTAKELKDLADPTEYVNVSSGRRLAINQETGVCTINGEELPPILASRLAALVRDGVPVMHLVKFYDNLQLNPSKRAVAELYTFLEHGGMPITPDGKFLGYKGINEDWTDVYTSTIENKVGNTISMPRNKVDDNCNNGCSVGFHVGSEDYATGWARGRVVIVEVDPADVVSVPLDCSCQKLRTCKYKVVAEYQTRMRDSGVDNPNLPYTTITSDDDGDDDEWMGEVEITVTHD